MISSNYSINALSSLSHLTQFLANSPFQWMMINYFADVAALSLTHSVTHNGKYWFLQNFLYFSEFQSDPKAFELCVSFSHCQSSSPHFLCCSWMVAIATLRNANWFFTNWIAYKTLSLSRIDRWEKRDFHLISHFQKLFIHLKWHERAAKSSFDPHHHFSFLKLVRSNLTISSHTNTQQTHTLDW